MTKDPITTDKYTVQEGDTLSGIAQRWGLGDDRTKNYQDLAKANQGVIGNDPNVIHPGQELTRQT
jgi:LysM repeat protein